MDSKMEAKGHLFGKRHRMHLPLVLAALLAFSALLAPLNAGEEFPDANEMPDANAGEDITGVLLNDPVKLDGSNSTDEDLDNSTWSWECTSHDDVNITDGGSPIASFIVFTEEPITFLLTLTDPEGEADTDEIDITPAVNQDPEMDTLFILPADSGAEGPFYEIGTPIEFNATTVSDPEGRDLTFSWSSDQTGEGIFPSVPAFIRTMNVLGWHNITITVEDPNGGTSSLVKNIKVREDRSAPVAKMTIWPIKEVHNKGDILRLDASQTEDLNSFDTMEAMNFTWSTNISGGKVLGYGSELNVSLDEGYHNITLVVIDTDGLTSMTWDAILIMNQHPEAVITTPDMRFRNSERTVNVTETASFSAYLSSDPNHDELEYKWDFNDGQTGTGKNTTHSWSNFGKFNVTLDIDDGSMIDSKANATISITVNTIPTAVIEAPGDVLVDEPFLFSANGSGDEDGDGLIFRWDLDGDGTFDQTGFNTTYTFREEVEITIKLRVEDGFAFTEAEMEISPKFPNEHPVPKIVGWKVGDNPIIVTLDDDEGEIELDASVSIDPDDDINNNGIIDEREKNNLTFSWYLDAGGDISDEDIIKDYDYTKKGDTVRVTIEGDGTHLVILNATDERGISSYMIIELYGDNPPVVTNLKTNMEQRLYVNSTVLFTATADDDDTGQRNKLKYNWDFGDGTIVNDTTSSYSHKFDEPGTYEILSWVTDGYLWASSQISVTVTEFEGLSVRIPKEGATLSGSVLLKGSVDHFIHYEIDSVEVRVDSGEWEKADNWPDWEFRLATWNYLDGEHTIEVRVELETGVEQTKEIKVIFSNTVETDNSGLITGVVLFIVVAIILSVVLYFLFGRKSNKARDLMMTMPPPPGMGPPAPRMAPPGMMQTPPASAPPAAQAPPKEDEKPIEKAEGPKMIRVKCPACKKVFKVEDKGERPIEMICTHCGAHGSISHVPGDNEEDTPLEDDKVEEKGPDPLSIVCPSCSGLFELDEVTNEAKCPFCNVSGELDDGTISELEERFGKKAEEDITVKCPSCLGKFSIKSSDSDIICPFCAATGNVPK